VPQQSAFDTFAVSWYEAADAPSYRKIDASRPDSEDGRPDGRLLRLPCLAATAQRAGVARVDVAPRHPLEGGRGVLADARGRAAGATAAPARRLIAAGLGPPRRDRRGALMPSQTTIPPPRSAARFWSRESPASRTARGPAHISVPGAVGAACSAW